MKENLISFCTQMRGKKATLKGELLTQKITFDTMDLIPTTLK